MAKRRGRPPRIGPRLRVTVDVLPEQQFLLGTLARQEQVGLAAILRRAIREFCERQAKLREAVS